VLASAPAHLRAISDGSTRRRPQAWVHDFSLLRRRVTLDVGAPIRLTRRAWLGVVHGGACCARRSPSDCKRVDLARDHTRRTARPSFQDETRSDLYRTNLP